MAKLKINFKGRPDRACSKDELRPAFGYIQIKNNCMVATNGYVLVRIPLSLSKVEGTELLEGCYIHKSQYSELMRYDIIQIKEKGEIIAIKTAFGQNFKVIFRLETEQSFEYRFPEWENVINFLPGSIDKIGLTPSAIKDLFSCFQGICTSEIWQMSFQSKTKGIHFLNREHENLLGLLMPAHLPD